MDLDQTPLPIDAVEFIPEPATIGVEGGLGLACNLEGTGDLVLERFVAYAAERGVDLPRDARRILRWAQTNRHIADGPEEGMLAILRYHDTPFYWCGLTDKVSEGVTVLVLAYPMVAGDATRLKYIPANHHATLEWDDAWHVVGYIRI